MRVETSILSLINFPQDISEASILVVWIAPFLFVAIICNSFFYIATDVMLRGELSIKPICFLKYC